MKSPPNFSDQNNVMGTGASDVERRVEKIDKKLTRGNRESHKLTKLYKKYKKFTNIMKKLGSFMKFWTKKVLMGIINSVYAIMYDTRVKKEKTDAGLPARAFPRLDSPHHVPARTAGVPFAQRRTAALLNGTPHCAA